jgi:spermidine synthase
MKLRQRLWNPYVLVFLSNSCIMVIELVASRLIAPRVGVSLYTWTSVIGVILAGISIGNAIGGRLADRWASTSLLGGILSAAALSSLLILWLNNDLHDWQLPAAVPLMVWIILYIAAVFMLPSIILGCVSPVVVKLSLTSLNRTGRTVGQIYAWSSIGSIVGTFLTGFGLISWFGTKTTILLVAGLLLLLGIWFLSDTTWRKALVRVLLVVALGASGYYALDRGGYLCGECLRESNYFCINVNEKEIGDRTVRELILDRLVHSYADLEDPTNLAYGYERTYAQIIQPLMIAKPALDAFFIGGGGYTFPRYMEATFPESHLVVAEIDPEVTVTAQAMLGLPQDTRIETHNRDARLYLDHQCPSDAYDIVFGDAFNDYSVPYHLTTREFARTIDRVLRDDGVYMANIIDGGRFGHFFRAYVATIRSVFPYVAVIPSLNSWQDEIRSTFVVVASQQPLALDNVDPGYRPLTEEELNAYMAMEPYVLLTDDYVPVDNLMAPVVEASWQGTQLTAEIMTQIRSRMWAVAWVAGALGAATIGLVVWRRRVAVRAGDQRDSNTQ